MSSSIKVVLGKDVDNENSALNTYLKGASGGSLVLPFLIKSPPPPPQSVSQFAATITDSLTSWTLNRNGGSTLHEYSGTWIDGLNNTNAWFQVRHTDVPSRYVQLHLEFKEPFVMTGFMWMWNIGAPEKRPRTVEIKEYKDAAFNTLETINLNADATPTQYDLAKKSSNTNIFRFTFRDSTDWAYIGLQYFVPIGYVK